MSLAHSPEETASRSSPANLISRAVRMRREIVRYMLAAPYPALTEVLVRRHGRNAPERPSGVRGCWPYSTTTRRTVSLNGIGDPARPPTRLIRNLSTTPTRLRRRLIIRLRREG